MKKILGLDLGSSSVGWAFILEDEMQSKILGAGVRLVSLSSDESNDFQKGNAISINKDRTLRRGARRGLQRFKQRRDAILRKFKSIGFITNEFKQAEDSTLFTHYSYAIRSKAATEAVTKEEFVSVLLMLNKKRGYKSSRKDAPLVEGSQENDVIFDGMDVARKLYQQNLTPGQYALSVLEKGGEVPAFYASDLTNELKRIVTFQLVGNENLPADLLDLVLNKSRNATYYFFDKILNIPIAENKGSKEDIKKQRFIWRAEAVSQKVDASVLAFIIGDLNDQISKSSNYLGKISDNSKELLINNLTVGQFQFQALVENPHASQRNVVFKRTDYLNEFEQIWEVQKKFHPELTEELKKEIRDVTIFYQRKLKSQKHLISFCEFEPRNRVAPKSSPIFQLFRMWQNVNNLVSKNNLVIDEDVREGIIEILSYNGTLNEKELLKLLGLNHSIDKLNFEKINGDQTRTNFLKVFIQLWEKQGNSKKNLGTPLTRMDVALILKDLGLPGDLLDLNPNLKDNAFDKQPYYQLWHLLYSLDDDALVKRTLINRFGFSESLAQAMLYVKLESNYASLSVKAMRKILPHLMDGLKAPDALKYVYHSESTASETIVLKDKLDLVKKNSLRNPVVEKVLNQTINVVNAIIASDLYGRPDEIRIELARELRASNEERSAMTKNLMDGTKKNETIRKQLQENFRIQRVTKNDIIRYKLWEETGGISIYTGNTIQASDIFGGKYDIDHIIPQSRLFDDSFSNKTLCERALNIEKGNQTAYSFLKQKYSPAEFEQYLSRVKDLEKSEKIKKTKAFKLTLTNEKIPDDFITRQLNETQYISKKAKEILTTICDKVYTTTGSVTDRLREDWGLVDMMKELNFEKYKALGLTYEDKGKNGERLLKIKDWSKRNDHRHHAMDAITIALTKQAYILYLNNLNANIGGIIQGNIENKYTERIGGKIVFKSPMVNIRDEFKRTLDAILISHKAKNKVVTKNKNKIKTKAGLVIQHTLTPRGQLHKETIYGAQNTYETKWVAINAKMDADLISKVANKKQREALTARLAAFDNDPKKAFSGKNSPSNNPIYLDENKRYTLNDKVKLVDLVPQFTIRKNIGPDLDVKKIEKVVDIGIKNKLMERLQAFGGDPKKAFSNLDENPIFLDKAQKISIKTVKMQGVNNALALHSYVDNNEILKPKDWVSSGNNHHIAIYEDENGDYQDEVVSFFTAVTRATSIPPLPIIQKHHEKGWKFLFTMKANELFIFPSEEFNPTEVDLTNPANYSQISKHLYRVQKLALKYYVFRHHLETNVEDTKELCDIAWKRIQSNNHLKGIIKIRVNHLGQIVKTGEY